MASLEFLAIILTGLGLTTSIIYYASILRNANETQKMQLETRQTQLFMYLYDKFCSESFKRSYFEVMSWEWDDVDDYFEKYGPLTNPENEIKRQNVGSFFEGLGVLVKNKQISSELVDDLMSYLILTYWEKFEPITKEIRVKMNYPNFGEWVEYLYSEVKLIAEKQHLEYR